MFFLFVVCMTNFGPSEYLHVRQLKLRMTCHASWANPVKKVPVTAVIVEAIFTISTDTGA